VGAWRAEVVRRARVVVVAVEVGVVEMSTSELSGVVGREVCVLKEGRRSDVRLGEGGSGVGGRL
jgi:hypothetical protein